MGRRKRTRLAFPLSPVPYVSTGPESRSVCADIFSRVVRQTITTTTDHTPRWESGALQSGPQSPSSSSRALFFNPNWFPPRQIIFSLLTRFLSLFFICIDWIASGRGAVVENIYFSALHSARSPHIGQGNYLLDDWTDVEPNKIFIRQMCSYRDSVMYET